MDFLMNLKWGTGVEELAFVLSIAVVSFFYTAYKNCQAEIEKEKMLEQFLNE